MALLVGGGDIFGSFQSVPSKNTNEKNVNIEPEEEVQWLEDTAEEQQEFDGGGAVITKWEKTWKIVQLICSSTTSTVLTCFTSILPLFSIILGSTNINNCPAEPRIPVFLVVGGVMGIIHFIFHIAVIIFKHSGKIKTDRRKFIINFINGLFITIFVSVAISGGFLVFGLEPTFEDEISEKYFCHKLTYYFAFALSAVFFLASLFAIVTGLVGVLAVWSLRKK